MTDVKEEGKRTNLKCKDCGRDFYITEKEEGFYKEMGYQLPKRCFACRKLNKSRRLNG